MIPPEKIYELIGFGFKVVPMDAESKKPSMSWSQIHDDGGWDAAVLRPHLDKFHNIATCFGFVKSKNKYLNCLDIDSPKVFDKLRNVRNPKTGEAYSLIYNSCLQTWITKTRKAYGYHIYWFSNSQLEPVHSHDCKEGYEFEIKTDKTGGLCHLPPSVHRNDKNFQYSNIGQNQIGTSDHIYDVLMRELGEFLKVKQPKPTTGYIASETKPLDDEKIDKVVEVISTLAYKGGQRNMACLALSGILHRYGVDYDSARKVFTKLVEVTKDEEKHSRLATLNETYRKERAKVAGLTTLKQLNPAAAVKIGQLISQVEQKTSKS